MGYYINHDFLNHEEWLARYATPLPAAPTHHLRGDRITLCLVDNGLFTALGVMFSPRELDYWTQPEPRPKQWYTAPLAEVQSVVPWLEVEK